MRVLSADSRGQQARDDAVVAFGIGGSNLISKLAGWPTFISSLSILIAVFSSAGVGIFFGFYPARKAASLSPIEALRYE